MANYIEQVSRRKPLTTLILFMFLGAVGAHRFYLGRVGSGLFFALTGALGGFALIYDFLKLLFSGIKDDEGLYLRIDFFKKLLLLVVSFMMWSIGLLLLISFILI